jgi:hypothetical protein
VITPAHELGAQARASSSAAPHPLLQHEPEDFSINHLEGMLSRRSSRSAEECGQRSDTARSVWLRWSWRHPSRQSGVGGRTWTLFWIPVATAAAARETAAGRGGSPEGTSSNLLPCRRAKPAAAFLSTRNTMHTAVVAGHQPAAAGYYPGTEVGHVGRISIRPSPGRIDIRPTIFRAGVIAAWPPRPSRSEEGGCMAVTRVR